MKNSHTALTLSADPRQRQHRIEFLHLHIYAGYYKSIRQKIRRITLHGKKCASLSSSAKRVKQNRTHKVSDVKVGIHRETSVKGRLTQRLTLP